MVGVRRGGDVVRVVVAGDSGTGKTSLVHGAPRFLHCDGVPIKIIDTSSRTEDTDKVTEELQRADSVVLTYACDRSETLENLTTFWLPRLRKLEVKAPVIVAGCKLDLLDENQQVSLEQVMSPLMQQFCEIQACVECSSYKTFEVREVFFFAQKAALYPMAPLFDQESQTLTPRCVRALKRIFTLCDHDKDGL